MDEPFRFYETERLTEKDTQPVEQARMHHQLNGERLTGSISFHLRCRGPLHVSSGELLPPHLVNLESDAPLIKGFYRTQERPTIPGSSLKGAVRSLVEAITDSCVCKTRDRLDRARYGECRYSSQRRWVELCPACRIFGAMGYQGQTSFQDLPLLEGEMVLAFIPAQYQPRSNGERRYYPHRLKDEREATWPLEVAAKGATFAGRIGFRNLQASELGVLLIALGQGDPSVCLKMGGGKSAGLGAVQFENVVAARVDPAKLCMVYDATEAWTPVDVAAAIGAADDLLRSDRDARRVLNELACSQLQEGD